MKETIQKELAKIENTESIKILYAVESGSRAWGFPSKDSDYDVRFIYTRPKKWYLQLQKTRNTLEYPLSDLLDISGWDLNKTLLLLQKSNPSLLEWLYSPIVYSVHPVFHQDIVALTSEATDQKSLIYHYLHMAEGNYRDYLQSKYVKIKKYFYVLRPLLACRWIETCSQIPPVNFQQLMEQPGLSQSFLQETNQLLEKKTAGEEMALEPKITVIDQFIQEQLEYYSQFVQHLESTKKLTDTQINQFFQKWYGY